MSQIVTPRSSPRFKLSASRRLLTGEFDVWYQIFAYAGIVPIIHIRQVSSVLDPSEAFTLISWLMSLTLI